MVPVARCVAAADAIAGYDLTEILVLDQRDEMGQMARAMNTMASNLRNLVLQIQDGATHVSSSSEEISASAQQLASGVTLDRHAGCAALGQRGTRNDPDCHRRLLTRGQVDLGW